jgi:hypothetical protein
MGKRHRILYLFLFAFAFILVTCGGDGGEDSNGPWMSTIPADGATGVATNSVITITFDEAMDASTINVGTFTVSKGGSAVAGSVTYDPGTRTATFSSAAPFAFATRYTAKITGLRDLKGTPKIDYAWSFTTRGDGTWGTAQLIETNAGNALYPQIAMNAGGNAIAVWNQYDGTTNAYHIWAIRYVAGVGWGTAQLIENNNGDASNPQIAMDGSGNAIAVWNQSDGTLINIWANRYVAGVGWGTAQLIETNNAGNAGGANIAMNPSGNAIAVWYQYDSAGKGHIWANRYVVGSGWGTAQLIENNNATASSPQIAMDGSGNAIAVWSQYDGSWNRIWANRYVVGSGWGTAQLIENNNATASSPQIAMNANGNAIAVWKLYYENTQFDIWANRYVAGVGWGTIQLIETDNAGNADYPQIAMDGSGNAIAVWKQSDGTRTNIWANRYVVGSGWGTAQLIETDNAGNADYPQIAMDGSGNATVVWTQSDGTRTNIWAIRYVAGSGWWGTAQPIETDNAGDADYPRIATGGSGNAIAVWQQSDGTRTNIWANQFMRY